MDNQTKGNKGLLQEKTFAFAVRVVKMYRYLHDERKEMVLSKQILRSGTNPGAMMREAVFAESSSDFVHKMAIARKEISETLYWLDLLLASNYLDSAVHASMHADAEEILKILTSSIKTKKKNM